MKMTLHKDNLTGRQPHTKTSHRQRKTTSQEDNLTGRPPPTKKTILKEELEERQHHRQINYIQPNRIKISCEGNIALCYVVN